MQVKEQAQAESVIQWLGAIQAILLWGYWENTLLTEKNN